MERKATRSRRRNPRRGDYPGRSAIHVCNTTRCVSVFFHSLVPVFDTSDPLKRLPSRLHPRSHSRPIQPCKERTMPHAARPRGARPARGQASRPVKKRERFETETHRRHRRVVAAGCMPVTLQAPHIQRSPAVGRERPASPLPATRHRPAGTGTRRMPDTKQRLDIDSRPPVYGTGRDNRAASRPGIVLRRAPTGAGSATLGRPARASHKHASIRTRSAARSRCLASKDSP